MKRKKNNVPSQYLEYNDALIAEYEKLRLLIIDENGRIFSKNFSCLVCQGMLLWMKSLIADNKKRKAEVPSRESRQENVQESEMVRTIADILFKKFKDRKYDTSSKVASKPLRA